MMPSRYPIFSRCFYSSIRITLPMLFKVYKSIGTHLKIQTALHASSVKTSMHRIGPLSFLRSIFAKKARDHRELISTIVHTSSVKEYIYILNFLLE